MKIIKLIAAVLALATLSQPASATSYVGTFDDPGDIKIFNFTVAAPSFVTIRTFSYAGGVNGDGTVIPLGGFDPIVSLFGAANNLIDYNDDGGSMVGIDPGTAKHYDSYLARILDPGDYFVALTVYPGFPLSDDFADGFFPATTFTDISNISPYDRRNGNYALDITQGAVPEPATWAMMIIGFGFVGGAIRYRRANGQGRAALA